MATQTTNYHLTKPAWDEMVDVTVLNDNNDIIDAQMHANELAAAQAVVNMADAYDATATYQEGDYCTYGGKLYQANTDISTAEAFDATHWDETTAAEHFSDGGGGGGTLIQPVIYSDTEREIGVWRDGKPLYQITYTTTISSNVASMTIDITALNVDTVVDMYGTLNSQIAVKPIPNVDDSSTSNNYALDIINNKTTLRLTKGSGYFIEGPLYITLRYTKTTDTAGSGTWTPSGVPAVHYSTDEQVVGTWIDGKTLYQKTFYYTHNDTIGGGFTTIGTISGYEYLQFVNCMFYNPSQGRYYSIPYANGSATTVPYLENGNIQLRVSSDTWGYEWDVVITVQYTKASS